MTKKNYVTHLECGMNGTVLDKNLIHNLSPDGYPILVRYNLEKVKKTISKSELKNRPQDMWRFHELLPVNDHTNIVSLGEMWTPLIAMKKLQKKIGGGEIIVKDEGRLPTGSFKTRGLAMAITMAKEFGIKKIAMPTNGNAGAALSAYATRAGIENIILCPDDTPAINMAEIAMQGGKIYRVNGLINDCGKIVGEGKNIGNWFDFSTLKEPYRIEGKKTMGLELAEQYGWNTPDVIFYPTGGGTGLIGMWKAFLELKEIGFINRFPRMVAVQAKGCQPIVRAYQDNKRKADLFEGAHTIASGIRVPIAIGDFLILDAIKDSNGFAIAVDDEEIKSALIEVGHNEGLLLCPEGAATYAAYKNAYNSGLINKTDNVLLFNCATGLKYPMQVPQNNLDRYKEIDYTTL